MFGISGTELFIIIVFVLLIFGPDKLPAVGRTVGQMMREFKRAQQTMESLIKAEMAAAEKQKEEEQPSAESTEEGASKSGAESGTETPAEGSAGASTESGKNASAEGSTEASAEGSTEAPAEPIPGDVDDPDVEPATAEEAGGWTPGVTGPDAAAQTESVAEVEVEPSGTTPDERKEEEEAL